MKAIISAFVLLASISASAASTYCRLVGGGLGAPAGSQSKHCVTFNDDKTLTDNSSTFFGNPPETLRYRVDGENIMVLKQGSWQPRFQLVNGVVLYNGTVMERN